MNPSQAAGNWEQVQGRAKKVWPQLTDADFRRADSSVDKLYGVIKGRFGGTKEEIKTKLETPKKTS